MAHCRDRLTNYQGFGGKAKLRSNMKGRRTKQEEEAYGSARVLVSAIMKEARVRVPETRGGDTSKTRGANTKPKAAAKGKARANDNRPTIRKIKSADELVAYALVQAKALQGTLNKSAAVAPARLGKAINAFFSEVLAVSNGE